MPIGFKCIHRSYELLLLFTGIRCGLVFHEAYKWPSDVPAGASYMWQDQTLDRESLKYCSKPTAVGCLEGEVSSFYSLRQTVRHLEQLTVLQRLTQPSAGSRIASVY